MSGPKVVRIVTREEVIATCELHLAGLNQAVNRWISKGQKEGIISEQDIAQINKRRQALQELLERDAFEELQKQVSIEIDYLKTDMKARLDKAIRKAAAEKAMKRRQGAAAQSVLTALEGSGKAIPQDLRNSLTRLISGETAVDEAGGVFARAFGLLSASESTSTSKQQKELAQSLATGEATQSFADWRTNHLMQGDSVRLEKLERRILELSGHPKDPISAQLASRLRAVYSQPHAGQRTLLMDSLEVDIADTLRRALKQDELLDELEDCLAQVKGYERAPAREIAGKIEQALTSADTASAADLIAQAKEVVASEVEAIAAAARRRAILQGLADLGYEVREGMETTFTQSCSLILRRPSTPGFGLEMSGSPEENRLQVRVVAFGQPGNPRDKSRDRDIETQWCGDLDRLKKTLADAGGEIAVERALVAGAAPLKIIEDEAQKDRSIGAEAAPRQRQIDSPRRR